MPTPRLLETMVLPAPPFGDTTTTRALVEASTAGRLCRAVYSRRFSVATSTRARLLFSSVPSAAGLHTSRAPASSAARSISGSGSAMMITPTSRRVLSSFWVISSPSAVATWGPSTMVGGSSPSRSSTPQRTSVMFPSTASAKRPCRSSSTPMRPSRDMVSTLYHSPDHPGAGQPDI